MFLIMEFMPYGAGRGDPIDAHRLACSFDQKLRNGKISTRSSGFTSSSSLISRSKFSRGRQRVFPPYPFRDLALYNEEGTRQL